MSDKEAIEEEILKVYYKMGIDKKDNVSPASVSLDFTEHENRAMRHGHWYVENEVLRISATDTSLESCLKSLATKFAWLSVAETKYSLGMIIVLGLTLSPIFLWTTGVSFILLTSISVLAFISVPFVLYWSYTGIMLEEAEIKFLMTETRVIFGEEEIEEYFDSLSYPRMSRWMWVMLIIGAEFFNLFLALAFMRGF